MKKTATSQLLSVLCAAWCAACGGTAERSVPTPGPPLALDRHLVWVDTDAERAMLLDVGATRPQPELKSIDLKGRPSLVQRHLGHDQVLSLVFDEDAETTELVVFSPKGVQARYDLGTRFDSITQSDDGRYAIVHFAPGGGNSEASSLLFNPNEIAIVDLERSGDDAVVARTLRSYGSGPKRVEFSPAMDLAGERRRLAAVLFDSQLALFDLNHLDRPEFTIELSRNSNVTLSQLRFSPEDQKIYLLAQGSNDVYVVRLLPAGANRQNDFEPSLNQLGADAAPQDMVVFNSSVGARLLVASGGSAQVVEASSSRVTQIPLGTAASRILLFQGTSPFDDEQETRALLYATGQGAVSFLDLEEVEDRTTRNLETLSVAGGISQLVPLNNNQVLITQAGGGVNILDLQARTASPIQARIGLSAVVPSLETGRIWAAPEGGTALGYIDLNNLHPGQVNLDEPISNLFVFNETSPPRIAVVHPSTQGSVSILNGADPSNAKQAVTLQGFFLEGILDQ